jgi:hypothetical protein
VPVPTPPAERAPLLRVFGGLAEQVAVLIRLRPSLAHRLVFAPPQAMHAVAAYLHHGVSADLPDAEIAEIIETHHPRDLLSQTFPDVPMALYRALGRSDDRACEPKIYLRAATVSCGPFADAYLAGDPLHPGRLKYYEALATFDPHVAAMHRALPEDYATAEAVNNVIGVLRAYHALAGADLPLSPSAGQRAVLRRLYHLLDTVQAPAVPFAVPAPLRSIDSVGALRREGLRFKNCIRDRWHGPRYWLGHARGEDVFIVSDAPPFIARLSRAAPDLYVLSEIAGPSNEAVEDSSRASLLAALRQAGANIVETDPAHALTRLLDRLGSGTRADDGGHDEAGINDALDDLAA